jgi:alanine dehydrogenase
MKKLKILLLRERKLPADSRVALSPEQAAKLNKTYPNIEVCLEPSDDRVFENAEYQALGVKLEKDRNQCDVFLGVKEVPPYELIEGKTYFFFSHTHKMQEYNRPLLQAAIDKKIRLIDYECLEWPKGGRVLGFGRWAGIVGVYNGFLTWGKKHQTFDLKPAYQCSGYEELKKELSKVTLGTIKIALTGTGRVAAGALEVLNYMGIQEVSPSQYLHKSFETAVFTNLKNQHLYERKDGVTHWNSAHFYKNHELYQGKSGEYWEHTDLLINGMYWEESLPRLFSKAETKGNDFTIKVIADITCDVEGSVPITLEATTILNPVIGWDKSKLKGTTPYGANTIDVMAVTNLPTELPADASSDFGEALMKDVIPLLLNDDPEKILEHATITDHGKLTSKFLYLDDFLNLKKD